MANPRETSRSGKEAKTETMSAMPNPPSAVTSNGAARLLPATIHVPRAYGFGLHPGISQIVACAKKPRQAGTATIAAAIFRIALGIIFMMLNVEVTGSPTPTVQLEVKRSSAILRPPACYTANLKRIEFFPAIGHLNEIP